MGTFLISGCRVVALGRLPVNVAVVRSLAAGAEVAGLILWRTRAMAAGGMQADLLQGFFLGELLVEPLKGEVRSGAGSAHLPPKAAEVLRECRQQLPV